MKNAVADASAILAQFFGSTQLKSAQTFPKPLIKEYITLEYVQEKWQTESCVVYPPPLSSVYPTIVRKDHCRASESGPSHRSQPRSSSQNFRVVFRTGLCYNHRKIQWCSRLHSEYRYGKPFRPIINICQVPNRSKGSPNMDFFVREVRECIAGDLLIVR